MKEKVVQGKPHAGNPHVWFDEGADVPRHSGRPALLYKGCRRLLASMVAIAAAVAMAEEVKSVAGNPFSALTGQPVGDPHVVEGKGRLYMFA